jgi:ornithine cyclodeaminase/alanine dehydrogenase-like protein (mu-crystallin family)
MLQHLSYEDCAELGITTAEVVQSIKDLIVAQAEDKMWNAPKAVILPPDGRYLMAALAACTDPPLLAVKSVVLNPRNPDKGLKIINGVVTLLDAETGLPLATVDGNWVTALRTAGLSAVAAQYLGRPDSSVAAFVGCGVQAHSHLDAFADLFPLKEIRALGRGTTNRDALCDAARAKGLSAVASANAKEALTGADLIVTSVTRGVTPKPFLDARWLKPGAFAAIADAAQPWIPATLSAIERVIIDDLEQEAVSGPMVDPDLVKGDLSGLVQATVSGRESEDEINAFVFRGVALGDLALAGLAYRRACS